MVVDTSTVVAVVAGESDRLEIVEVLRAADAVLMSPASYLEAAMVLSRKVAQPRLGLDQFLAAFAIQVVPTSLSMARVAADAFERFGKGRGHPAQLNFGDCLVYALAKATGEPLLYKGDDFSHTDVEAVPLGPR